MPNETIAEKLIKLNQIKADLKTQIEAKGVTVGTADFEDYPGLVEDIPSGGGMYYSTFNGTPYVKNLVIPSGTMSSPSLPMIRNCPNLESIRVEATSLYKSQWYCFAANSALKTLELPYTTDYSGGGALASLYNMSGDNHGTVQLGSIGYPVTAMNQHTFFAVDGVNTGGAGWTVTIYVNASTLADIPSAVNQYQPWNATNATIVYRNSTTGEVITE